MTLLGITILKNDFLELRSMRFVFGFSLITLAVVTLGTLSAMSTLLVISACVVSGNASRSRELAFNVYLQERMERSRGAPPLSAQSRHRRPADLEAALNKSHSEDATSAETDLPVTADINS